jgi:hypothetical protein
MKKCSIYICLLLTLLNATSWAQKVVRSEVQIDTNQIRIGEPVTLIWKAVVSSEQKNLAIQWPLFPDSTQKLELTSIPKLDTLTSGSDVIYQQTLQITSFEEGNWEWPSMQAYVLTDGTGLVDSFQSRPIVIKVSTVDADTSQPFKAIKPLQEVRFNFWDYWMYILAGLLLLLLIVWFVRRKKPIDTKISEPSIQTPPHVLALEQLRLLEKQKPWEQDVKRYYTDLTDILRTYFEKGFGLAAQESTTAELLNDIKPITQLNQQRVNIESILRLADLAKFAKWQPEPDDHQRCLNKAMEIVEWTKPQQSSKEL